MLFITYNVQYWFLTKIFFQNRGSLGLRAKALGLGWAGDAFGYRKKNP